MPRDGRPGQATAVTKKGKVNARWYDSRFPSSVFRFLGPLPEYELRSCSPGMTKILWREKQSVHRQKIPCYSLLMSLGAGAEVRESPVVIGLNAHRVRRKIKNSLLNSLLPGNWPAGGISSAPARLRASRRPERNDFSSNHHSALSCCFVAVPDAKVLHTFAETALVA